MIMMMIMIVVRKQELTFYLFYSILFYYFLQKGTVQSGEGNMYKDIGDDGTAMVMNIEMNKEAAVVATAGKEISD